MAEGNRILWIDAICIDQNSLSEKTHQVGMIRDIYRGASRVLIWLGESDRDIRKAMAFLEQRKKFQLLTRDELNPFVSGLTKIFKQPWWSRIRVVQEVLVANKPPLLGCGRKWLSWEDIAIGVADLKRQQTVVEGAESSFENPMAFYDLGLMTSELRNDGHHGKGLRSKGIRSSLENMLLTWNSQILGPCGNGGGVWRTSLSQLAIANCNRNTTQPHYKIFPLLGLTLDSVLDEVPINYN